MITVKLQKVEFDNFKKGDPIAVNRFEDFHSLEVGLVEKVDRLTEVITVRFYPFKTGELRDYQYVQRG